MLLIFLELMQDKNKFDVIIQKYSAGKIFFDIILKH